MYGMKGNSSYKKQYERILENSFTKGELSITEYHLRKQSMKTKDLAGMEDGHSCTKGVVPFLNDMPEWFEKRDFKNLTFQTIILLLVHQVKYVMQMLTLHVYTRWNYNGWQNIGSVIICQNTIKLKVVKDIAFRNNNIQSRIIQKEKGNGGGIKFVIQH